jgi:hypothetical protein
MKIAVGILLGLLGGFLIYMEAAMLLSGLNSTPSGAFVAIFFLGGATLCAYLAVRGAKTATKVLARGSLTGAVLWFLMLVSGVIFSGRAVHETVANETSKAAQAGAAMGGGLIAILTGGVSIFMVIVCLISFAVFRHLGRELKKCPQCAELVKVEARKCKHCGAIMAPESNLVASPSPGQASPQ